MRMKDSGVKITVGEVFCRAVLTDCYAAAVVTSLQLPEHSEAFMKLFSRPKNTNTLYGPCMANKAPFLPHSLRMLCEAKRTVGK